MVARGVKRKWGDQMGTTAATLAGGQATIDDADLQALSAELRGAALAASAPEAAAVRPPFNAMHQPKPALTIECSGTADVVDAVTFARERGLAVAVRGGGHSIAGLSSIDGGLLIDLAHMNAVIVDPERRLAQVQGGALWADVDREAQAFGLATPGGVVSDTGVAGLTLGGGYGWLRRKYGLSSDNVVEAQVVCADGTVRRAAADSDPDLLWAIRGGGGNFGVVTSFTFRLHPVGPIVPFAGVFYPAEDAAEVLRRWRDVVTELPREITSECVSLTFPPDPAMPEVIHNRPAIVVGAVNAGVGGDGMAELQPLRELGTPLFDLSQPMPYRAVQSAFDPLFPRNTLRGYWKSVYLDEMTDAATEAVARAVITRPAPLTLVNILHMGGAIEDLGPDETAFAERDAPFMVSVDGMWPDPADDAANIAWVRKSWSEVARHGTGRVYLNFMGADEDSGVDRALPESVERLRSVKAAYDPDNFFRRNNNVAPAG
jgi:FAD/FMN-containing dehydrogenase